MFLGIFFVRGKRVAAGEERRLNLKIAFCIFKFNSNNRLILKRGDNLKIAILFVGVWLGFKVVKLIDSLIGKTFCEMTRGTQCERLMSTLNVYTWGSRIFK